MVALGPFMRPTYKGGFARFAGESEYPQLWDGLQTILAPTLGPTGLTVHDPSRHHNDTTLTNMDPATDWVLDPEMGWVLYFDASDDYMNAGTLDYTGFDGISLLAIVKAATRGVTTFRRIISIQYAGNDDIRLYYTPTTLYFTLDDGTVSEVTVGFTDSAAFHVIVGTYDGVTIRLYLDGQEVGTPAVDTYDFANTGGLTYIGARAGNPTVDTVLGGPLSLAGIWNRALLPSEIPIFNHGGPLTLKRRTIVRVPVAVTAGLPYYYNYVSRQMRGAA